MQLKIIMGLLSLSMSATELMQATPIHKYPVHETRLTNSHPLFSPYSKDAKENALRSLCLYFVFMLVCVHVCVPQLYTQLTVILDDPDFS